ncbi:2-oxo acid dehydrogenase subunit E2 [Streptomyces sp. SP17BM10]|uniref:2-oxo acid dehydrogenase subunit E2 n=1 Tax=Streptomyces sp. SP17BM10 TaxID=3002530 RepID=UPI002E76A7EE|nr:2-oxo acid dehydrogenase subunit E2 [Streptomyces sp. SP17BM10]MEE1784664.1 2-oxo acid dehydrogenase subunit E2 [Streptomyces sp. SP17BM10]
MTEIALPKLNNNDTEYELTEWLVDDGQWVSAGDVIAVVETSKSAVDFEAEQDGHVHRVVQERGTCRVGDVIAHVFATEQEREAFAAEAAARAVVAPEPDAEVVLTASARELAKSAGIDHERLRSLGRRVVRREDVEALLADRGQPATDGFALSRIQQAVAAVVTESHRTVPSAFVAVKVEVAAAQKHARRLGKESGTLVGLPELVVKAMARLREQFPLCYATGWDGGTVRLAETARIGVTIDAGAGLFVPVVGKAEVQSVAEIADTLLEFRTKAAAEGFAEADLADANIMLSLHTDPGVVTAGPIVFPGQSAVVCLAATHTELVLDEDGEVTPSKVALVSMVYDHRVLNGRDAVQYLSALKALIEAPAGLN